MHESVAQLKMSNCIAIVTSDRLKKEDVYIVCATKTCTYEVQHMSLLIVKDDYYFQYVLL